MKFKFGDYVKVITGFYKGQKGIVKHYYKIDKRYGVRLDNLWSYIGVQDQFKDNELEKTKTFGKRVREFIINISPPAILLSMIPAAVLAVYVPMIIAFLPMIISIGLFLVCIIFESDEE